MIVAGSGSGGGSGSVCGSGSGSDSSGRLSVQPLIYQINLHSFFTDANVAFEHTSVYDNIHSFVHPFLSTGCRYEIGCPLFMIEDIFI